MGYYMICSNVGGDITYRQLYVNRYKQVTKSSCWNADISTCCKLRLFKISRSIEDYLTDPSYKLLLSSKYPITKATNPELFI